jgi:peroxiredoxin
MPPFHQIFLMYWMAQCAFFSLLPASEIRAAQVNDAEIVGSRSDTPEACFDSLKDRIENAEVDDVLKLLDEVGTATFVSNIASMVVRLAQPTASVDANQNELHLKCQGIQKRFSLPNPEFFSSEKYFPRNAPESQGENQKRLNADVLEIVDSHGGKEAFLQVYLDIYRELSKHSKTSFQFFALVGEGTLVDQKDSAATIRVERSILLSFRKSDTGWRWSGIDFDRMYQEYTQLDLVQDVRLSGVTVSGESVDLENHRGKFVVIDFWGPNCGACIAELPSLKKIYAALNEYGFEIIGVSVSDSESLKNFLDSKPIPWKNIADEAFGRVNEFNIKALPTKLLINRDGQHYQSNLSGIRLMDEIISQLKLDPAKFADLRQDLLNSKNK